MTVTRILAGVQDSSARVALVTGGTSGIGAAIAGRIRSDGLRVAVTGRPRRDVERAGAPGDQDLLLLTGDLTEVGVVDRIVGQVVEHFGRLDIVINNAGRRHSGAIVETPAQEIADVFAINTFAAMAMTAAAARVMISQHDGVVINMVSRLATVGVADLTTYSASKGALLSYTRAAAIELAPHNVRVNAVAPGMTRTPLIDDWLAHQQDPEQALSETIADIPLGRLGSATDVAAAVSYLVSADAAYLTGICLPVDGGYTAR